MFTPKQISDMLNIPPSTVRRYAVDYADLLSSQAAQEGKKRRYTDNDVLTLRRVRELVAQHKGPGEVRALLQVIEQQQPAAQGEQPAEKALAVAYPELLEQLEYIKSALANKDAQINALTERLTALEQQAAQAAQLERDRQAAPWYKRLFAK